ncbi:hypothetical protein B9Z55_002997 [Caenorhabditis nigoni]|uniref:Uncharacterized protein n=1 Tax=Caenorhabditis nigoni TaxID=1611254 RepID=A0A2G5VN44_9PELO|nr:hypothetical protein B9Z55_002997 [Caenorhabditis nigoni]
MTYRGRNGFAPLFRARLYAPSETDVFDDIMERVDCMRGTLAARKSRRQLERKIKKEVAKLGLMKPEVTDSVFQRMKKFVRKIFGKGKNGEGVEKKEIERDE